MPACMHINQTDISMTTITFVISVHYNVAVENVLALHITFLAWIRKFVFVDFPYETYSYYGLNVLDDCVFCQYIGYLK